VSELQSVISYLISFDDDLKHPEEVGSAFIIVFGASVFFDLQSYYYYYYYYTRTDTYIFNNMSIIKDECNDLQIS